MDSKDCPPLGDPVCLKQDRNCVKKSQCKDHHRTASTSLFEMTYTRALVDRNSLKELHPLVSERSLSLDIDLHLEDLYRLIGGPKDGKTPSGTNIFRNAFSTLCESYSQAFHHRYMCSKSQTNIYYGTVVQGNAKAQFGDNYLTTGAVMGEDQGAGSQVACVARLESEAANYIASAPTTISIGTAQYSHLDSLPDSVSQTFCAPSTWPTGPRKDMVTSSALDTNRFTRPPFVVPPRQAITALTPTHLISLHPSHHVPYEVDVCPKPEVYSGHQSYLLPGKVSRTTLVIKLLLCCALLPIALADAASEFPVEIKVEIRLITTSPQTIITPYWIMFKCAIILVFVLCLIWPVVHLRVTTHTAGLDYGKVEPAIHENKSNENESRAPFNVSDCGGTGTRKPGESLNK